jgi:hypothetical protein
MLWEVITALPMAAQVIPLTAAFIWYLSIGGIYRDIRERRQKGRPAGVDEKGGS